MVNGMDNSNLDNVTIAETHRKTVPGNILGAGNSPLTLVFTHAPEIPAGMSSIVKLEYPGASTTAIKALDSGDSGLGIIIENPEPELDPQRIEAFKTVGFSTKGAVKAAIMEHYGQVAQSLAGQFFKSSQGDAPDLHVRSVVNEDGTYTVERARILMTGKANGHPFWRSGGNL